MDTLTTFDDYLVLPKFNTLSKSDYSDNDCLDSVVCGIPRSLPVLSAPMDSVASLDLITSLWDQGGLGILHRYQSIANLLQQVASLHIKSSFREDPILYGASVGTTRNYKQYVDALHCYMPDTCFFCIDVAHAGTAHTAKAIAYIKKVCPERHILVGNFGTGNDVFNLLSYIRRQKLCDTNNLTLRAGIGNGAGCRTSEFIGVGAPTAWAVNDIRVQRFNLPIVADGGMKNTGDICKAFALGASAVMLGSMFARTFEAPFTRIVGEDKNSNKLGVGSHRGMASPGALEAYKGAAYKKSSIEGGSMNFKVTKSVEDVCTEIKRALKTYLYYTGQGSIREGGAKVMRCSPNTSKYTGVFNVDSSTHST